MQKELLLIVILAFLYVFTGELSFSLLSGESIVNLGVFAPEGIALAFALFFGKRVLWGVFIGQFILAYTHTIQLLPAMEISFINTLEGYLAIVLFQKFKLSKKLESFRDVFGLFGLIALILQPFSAILSNTVLFFHGEAVMENVFYSTYSWWFGNVMGQFLFTPFLLLFFVNYKKLNLKEYFLYGVAFTFYIYFLTIAFALHNPFMLISLSLTAVLFVVANKGLTYGALLVVITAVVASYSVYLHVGAFSSLNMVDNTINYNLYVLSHIVTVWFFGILFEERKRYAEALEEKISQERKKNKEQALFLLQQNRLAQMGELISMIAHQWRQPLNNLSLINQLLVNKFQKGKLDEDGVEYFKVNSKKQIEFMSSTIDDFRNFFKHSETEKEFDIASVVHNVINLSGPVFEKNGISIIYDLEKKCKVLAHENSFAQVVLNIMNNAKDALIERDVKEKQIHVSLDAQGEDVLLSVEDNAGGIDSSIIEKIFDPYFSTKTNKNGTGLGLYMSKMIIEEQMKGDLKVQTTENGAKFIISVKGVCL